MSLLALLRGVGKKYVHVRWRLFALSFLMLGAAAALLRAAPPAWWEARGVTDPEAEPDNHAVANVGQLKHIASKAAEEMDDKLPLLGAGPEINNMVAGWSRTSPDNYNILNQGQLKHVAKQFYDRLSDFDYEGLPLEEGATYPWTSINPDPFLPVNLGQLKHVFSFDLNNLPELPAAGLRLWLRADQGLPLSGSVDVWEDQSSAGNDAFQTEPHLRPSVATDPTSGHAVVRFDGAGDELALPNFLNDESDPATQGEIYIVARLDVFDETYRGLCQFGTADGTVYYGGEGGIMWDDFGIDSTDSFPAPNSALLTQTHIYNSSIDQDESGTVSTVRFNGRILATRTATQVDFTSTPLLGGTNANGDPYLGDIAEVIVYDRALTPSERDTVHAYLAAKYSPPGITVPATPTLSAYAVTSTTADIVWSTATVSDQRLVATLERQTGAGPFLAIATLDNVLAYTDTGLVGGQTYTYRLKLASYAGKSGYSNVGSVTMPVGITPPPIVDLCLWLRSTAGLPLSGSVATWRDQSDAHNDAWENEPSARPQVIPDATPDGYPVVRFEGQQILRLPDLLSNSGAAEIIAVLKVGDKSSGVYGDKNNMIWDFGQAGTGYYKEEVSDIVYGHYNNFGLANGAQGEPALPVSLVSDYHIFSTANDGALWTERYNAVLRRSAADEDVAFSSQPTLGFGSFVGDFAEILVYTRVLTPAERDAVHAYLAAKYAPPGITVPATPTLTAYAATSATADIAWSTTSGADQRLVATLERQTGAGAFQVIATLDDTFSYTDTGLTPGESYTYRVKLASYAGTTAYSATASLTTSVGLTPPPTTDLRLWLRSTAVQATAGFVSVWNDQSQFTPPNHATQTDSVRQPWLVPNALNGYPVIRFDGDQGLDLPDLMAGASAGEIIAVLKVDDKTPGQYDNNNNDLWNFGRATGYYYDIPGAVACFRYNGFGIDSSHDAGGFPRSLVSSYHLHDTSSDSSASIERYNGAPYSTLSNPTVAFGSNPWLGSGFVGDFAEILVYDRVLTPAERTAVETYLIGKYAVNPSDIIIPSVPLGLSVSNLGPGSFSLSWTASTDNFVVTAYDVYRDGALIGSAPAAPSPSFLVTGLAPQNDYAMTVRARDAAGNSSAPSSTLEVTTPADTQAPTVPTGLASSNLTPASFTLSWSASTDNLAVTAYDIYRNGVLVGSAEASSNPAYQVAGLASAITYAMTVIARDGTGNVSAASSVLDVTTLTDSQAPTVPAGLAASALGASTFILSWSASTDNVEVAAYDVYRGGFLAGSVSPSLAPSFAVTGLTISTTYQMTVVARDAAGNASAASAALPVTTVNDTSAPSVPTGLIAFHVLGNSLSLGWTAATDNVGIAVYEIYRDGFLAGTTVGVAEPTFTVTGLAPLTAYAFTVLAKDGTGNASYLSAPLVVVTEDVPATLPGLRLWLKADVGVPVSGSVAVWADRSGLNNHATQTDPEAQPQVIPNAVNGRPVVRFEGNQSLRLPNLLSAAAAGEIVAVLKVDDKSSGVYGDKNNKLWDFGHAGTGYYKEEISDAVYSHYNQFGLAGAAQGEPALPVSLVAGYHLFSTANDGVLWTERYDGAVRNSAAAEPVAFTSEPSLGVGVFVGDFAEVLVYDRVLTSAERTAIEAYLFEKYALTPLDVTPPAAPFALSATGLTPVSFTLSWEAPTDNVAVAAYDIYRDGTLIGSAPAAPGPSFQVTGLVPATIYAMTVRARDAEGNASAPGGPLAVSTLDDVQAPTAPSALAASSLTTASLTLSWTASTDNIGVTAYDIYRDGALIGSATASSAPSFQITGLARQTTYALTVRARDVSGNVSAPGGPLAVTTLDDAEAPTAPSGLVASEISVDSFILSWLASQDNMGVLVYDVFRDGSLIQTTSGPSLAITHLAPATTYGLAVIARDGAGNVSVLAGPLNITTLADTTAPSVPSGLSASAVGPTSFRLSWAPSSDDVGVTAYAVYRDGVLAGSTSGTSLTLGGLVVNTTYQVTVRARDAVANASAVSTALDVTTLADTTAPSAPAGLSTVRILGTSVELIWVASTDNVAVTAYDIYRDGSLIDSTADATPAYTADGLVPLATYGFAVRARDGAGNVSALSATLSVTTQKNLALPGLRLWLRADEGTPASGPVAAWLDQSSLGNHAIQDHPSARPQLVTDILNGHPVLRFDGAHELRLPDVMNGAEAGEIIAVLKVGDKTPGQYSNTNNEVWNFGRPSGYSSTVNASHYFRYNGFGINGSHDSPDFPKSLVSSYHVHDTSSDSSSSVERINGAPYNIISAPVVAFGANPVLGVGFVGDFAEVFVYDRVLTPAERDTVHAYLIDKYALPGFPIPSTPVLTAYATSPTTADLAWRIGSGANQHLVATLERRTGTDAFEIVAPPIDSFSYIDTGLLPGQTYTYRLKLASYAGESAYSNLVTITTIASMPELPSSGLSLWLRSTAGLPGSGPVGVWADQSGHGNHATQSSLSQQPVVVDNTFQGFPVVRFDGAQRLHLSGFLSSISSAEILAVVKVKDKSLGGYSNLANEMWNFGTFGTSYGKYSASSLYSNHSNNFCSNAGHNQVDFPFAKVADYHIFTTTTAPALWAERYNGVTYRSSTGDGVVGCPNPSFGGNSFAGDFVEILIYNRALTAEERAAAEGYLAAKYGFTGLDGVPPASPAGLSITEIGSTWVTLAWNAASDDRAVAAYDLYRDNVLIASVSGTTLSTTLSGLIPETTYAFKVRARDDGGNVSAPGGTITATTVVDTTPPSPPGDLEVKKWAGTFVTLSWGYSFDNRAVVAYDIYLDGVLFASTPVTLRKYTLTGLTPHTTYSLTVRARDAAGNQSVEDRPLSVTTIPDVQPPGTPSGLVALPGQGNGVKLSWSASTDNVGIAGYEIYRSGILVHTTTGDATSYTVGGLDPLTAYSFRIRAKDTSGNYSALTATLIGTTQEASAAVPGLRLWLRADAGVVTDAQGLVSSWLDQSGLDNHAVQTFPTDRPRLVAGALGGLAVVRFEGAHELRLPDVMTGASGGEIIAVVKVFDKNAGGYSDKNNKLWEFGLSGTGYFKEHVNDTVYSHYNTFGLGQELTESAMPAYRVSDYHIFGTSSSPSAWSERYNGLITRSVPGQTAAFASNPALGNYSFAGDFAEIRVYDHVLTDLERAAVERYLNDKYSLVLDTQAPTEPQPLASSQVTASQATLVWPVSGDNVGVAGYELYRDGQWVASVRATAFTVSGLAPSSSYQFKVRARDAAGNVSAFSPALTVSTLSSPGAAFADSDADGLPDVWETAHDLDPDSAADALADGDGDGVNNLAEYLAGSDPGRASATDTVNTSALRVIWP